MAKLGFLVQGDVKEDSSQIQWKQATLGAFYGLLGGMAFALTASLVDVLLRPDLPLAVDWNVLETRCFVIGLSLMLIGVLTTMWTDTWPGLGSGALVAGLLALGSALYTSQSPTGIKLIILIFALIPVAVMSLPIVLLLRWLVQRHKDSLILKRPASRIVGLVLISLIVGTMGGSFLKMSPRAVSATRYLHNVMQLGNNQKILTVEGVSQHNGMSYHLYQRKSEVSTDGFIVRVEYEDGFAFNCEVVLYSGRNPRLSGCIPAP